MPTNITLKFTDDNPSGTNNNDGWRLYRIEQSDGTDPCPDTYTDGDMQGFPKPEPLNLIHHEHNPNMFADSGGKGEIEYVDDTVEPGKRYFYRPSFYRNGGADPGANNAPTTEAVYRLSTIGPIAVPSAGGLGYPYNIPSHTSGVINYASVEPVIHIKATEEIGIHGRGPLGYKSALTNQAESWKALKFENQTSGYDGHAWIDDINNTGPNDDLDPVPSIVCGGNTFSASKTQWDQVLKPDAASLVEPNIVHCPEGFTTFLLASPTRKKTDLIDDGQVYPVGFSGYKETNHPTPNTQYTAWHYAYFAFLSEAGYARIDSPSRNSKNIYWPRPSRIGSDFGTTGALPVTDFGYTDDRQGWWDYLADEVGYISKGFADNWYTHTHYLFAKGGSTGRLGQFSGGNFRFPSRSAGPRKDASTIGNHFIPGNGVPDAKLFHLFCIHVGPNFEQKVWVNGGDPVVDLGPYPQAESSEYSPPNARSEIGTFFNVDHVTGTGFYFSALNIAELLCFPTALSSADIQRVSDYLLNTDYSGYCANMSLYSGIPTY